MYRLFVAALMMCLGMNGYCQAPDSNYLYGIHWYDLDPNNSDVEAMTGGRGVWVVDQVLLDSVATVAEGNVWETPWVTVPEINRNQPYSKPGYFSAITAKGHSMIVRVQPYWGVNVPYPGDPYDNSAFAEDCKAAASLMRNVHIWQIGNEVNLEGENRRWNNFTQKYDLAWSSAELAQTPELYAATYLACRDKIHEVAPDTIPDRQIVLMQPNSPGGVEPGRFLSSDDFLARMIAAVPDKSKIDGFALHSYAAPGGVNYGATGFMDALKRQIMIIDQAGLGDRPLYITEMNKHMPNETEAAIGARFVTTAYQMLNDWNTGASQIWPADNPNHSIIGTAWFVYRAGAGWDDYSLKFWKKTSGGTILNDPWLAFQSAASMNYAKGSGAGPGLTVSNKWVDEPFNGAALDSTYPLPNWVVESSGGDVALTGSGAVRLRGTANYGVAALHTPQLPFTDFSMETDVTFVDPTPIASDEANFDIRFRQQSVSGGPGFSLTLYSDNSAVRPGEVWLRKTGTWNDIYKQGPVAGGIAAGDRLKVQVRAVGSVIETRIIRMPTAEVVLDWTGTTAVTSADWRTGGIGMMAYNMREVHVDHFFLAGPEFDLDSTYSRIEDWHLFY